MPPKYHHGIKATWWFLEAENPLSLQEPPRWEMYNFPMGRGSCYNTLPDYVQWPDLLGHGSCSITLASLDRSFEEECCSHMVDMLKESLLTLPPLLIDVQSYLDPSLQSCCEEDPLYNLS